MLPYRPRRADRSRDWSRRRRSAAILVAVAATLGLLTGLPAEAATTYGVFPTSLKPAETVGSTRPANLGMRFSTSTDGVLIGMEFYRSSKQRKAYPATLWSANGTALATGTLAASSRAGWQSVRFPSPVPIKAGTTYVVSYFASDGRYANTKNALSRAITRNGITVPAGGGVFRFAGSPALPTESRGSSYLIDVVFRATATSSPAPSPSPTTSPSSPPPTTAPASGPLTATEVRAAASKRVFFGHQSVGGNVLRGIRDTYSSFGVTMPPDPELSNQSASGLPASGPVLADAYVGTNQQPMGKIRAFEAYLRAGVGAGVDVALIKFCYADIRNMPGEDYATVDELFNAYAAMITRLERDFPGVRFIYATAPVENAAMKPSAPIAAYNANRARFNQLVRSRYGSTGWLWDVARTESTAPDGSRTTTTYNGQTHDALYAGYSTDGGHLDEDGRRAVAAPLIRLIARG